MADPAGADPAAEDTDPAAAAAAAESAATDRVVPAAAAGSGFDAAWDRLSVLRRDADPRDGENPDDPETVQAMPVVLEVPKSPRPDRRALLEAAATAAVACCLAPAAGDDGEWAAALQRWYGARIRKVARRARGARWDAVQALPGVTAEVGGARARAFVPGPVHRTDPLVDRLQIEGTDLPPGDAAEVAASARRWAGEGLPVLYVDRTLGMTVGKAAAQVGHASMLLAAEMGRDAARRWAAAGFPLRVPEVDAATFADARRGAVAVVADAGFTEVAPGAVTVAACAGPVAGSPGA
ncbi:peptidyl-tRNA hydrolase [Corynebacterium bovis]|uniref:peptidyl-tRNA hydrolase n=1 Tax=Corynebacterium bovis TaxID=36808 RepID=A0A426PWY1_9CORY|nr:peptidyl-tRNA hydrolase [Corynebacterium bovis]MDN8578962.1 peptidyl-tRNA hydrolase [Corynebacterium bovis]RRO85634.1 hypothetical protein CXF48_10165 [Corynebacterium bovis]RRO89680.1 hypothetical protein CXF30_02555 [Corynebacterium bovis]